MTLRLIHNFKVYYFLIWIFMNYFSPNATFPSTNKTDCHDITVSLNTNDSKIYIIYLQNYYLCHDIAELLLQLVLNTNQSITSIMELFFFKAMMVNSSTNINESINHFLSQIVTHKKGPWTICHKMKFSEFWSFNCRVLL
jgi:hypothetical protein